MLQSQPPQQPPLPRKYIGSGEDAIGCTPSLQLKDLTPYEKEVLGIVEEEME